MAMRPEHRQVQRWYQMRASRAALIAACGLLAAACGSTAAPTGSAGRSSGVAPATGAASSTGPASTTTAAKVSLDVTLTGANTTTQRWTLRCDPPGGTTPDAASACSKLIAGRGIIFNHHPMRIMCPMIMADARTFTISGTFFGQQVHETIVDGGCDLSHWATLHQIFN